jgi:hypothetical protein
MVPLLPQALIAVPSAQVSVEGSRQPVQAPHTPRVHTSLLAQAAQLAPRGPHCSAVMSSTHSPWLPRQPAQAPPPPAPPPPPPVPPPSPCPQAPAVHAWLPEHALHRAPAAPQALVATPGWHTPELSQHPLQLAGAQSGRQEPARQASAMGHSTEQRMEELPQPVKA